MTASRKVLMLGLDAANPALLRRWSADGTMPNLARLLPDTLLIDVEGPLGLEVAATWSTFVSGNGPGHHGISWVDWVMPGTYREQRMFGADMAHVVPFWLALGEAGRRVAILDVPFAPPAKRINGFQVTEWGAHEGLFGFQTTPPELKQQIKRMWGAYAAPLTCETRRLTGDGYRKLTDTIIAGIKTRGEMTRDLLADGNWSFAIQVFTEVHCAGHLLWHFHDAEHPGSEPAEVARLGNLMREVYIAADAAIGEILSVADDNTTILIGCLHAMDHTCGTSLLLPDMLEGVGALRRASRRRADDAPPVRKGGVKGLFKAAWQLIPAAIRVPLYEARQQVNRRWLRRGEPIDIVPAETRAFQTGYGAGSTFSGIRLNIRGREPEGILEAGAEVDRYCAELSAALAEFTDPDTGQQLVQRVLRTDDLYQGPRRHDLADLLVEWQHDPHRGSTVIGSGNGGVWRGYSKRTGPIEHSNGSGRSGSHRLRGLLFVHGPGITPGALGRVVPTVNFAPTISRMLDVDFVGGDGVLIPELLPPD